MSEDKSINELTKIKGLNKKVAAKLYRAGVKSIKKLGSSNPEELSKLTGIAKKQLTTWIILARAQERKKFIEVDTAAAEISQLLEIKLEDAKKLVSAGVMSVDDLAEESSDLLSEDTGMAVDVINRWIKKAKEVKKIPADKRKVVVAPTAESSIGAKLSGAFLGSSQGFNNIYSDSSSFGQSFMFVLITAVLLCFYLSMSQASFGGFSLATIWAMTQISMEFSIGAMTITFYPIVFLGGIVLILVVWLIFGKVVSSSKNLEFKNTSAVLGFAMAPGLLLFVVIVGKFVISGDNRTLILPVLLVVFSVWVLIVFVRGLAFSPGSQATSDVGWSSKKTETASSELEVVETSASAPFSVAEQKAGPINLSTFGIIEGAALDALQKAGYVSSLDLLRASSKAIADSTGIQQSRIIIWRIISDLLRISGMNLEYAMILAKAGVRSVKHLSKINENALKVQVLDIISKENISTTISAQMLADWITKSKSL
ncbi:MAG TPA: DUF4332 domain-containing protein [Candidatus Deferrimicrobium sp.]|nr:DUF4332 domain-containing protein [Candidatus Deferrimicrobium sp.]